MPSIQKTGKLGPDLNLTGSEDVFLEAFLEVQGFFRELRNNYDRMAFRFLTWDVEKRGNVPARDLLKISYIRKTWKRKCSGHIWTE